MKKFATILILLIFINYGYSQVGGISASKLATLCTETVGEKSIEFEPVFGVSFVQKAWDADKKLYSLFSDSVQNSAELGFRMSYGLFENLEVGITFPVDLSVLSTGIKYKLPFESRYSLALLSGFNAVIGNQEVDKLNKTLDNTSAYVGGVAMCYEFTDNFEVDMDIQYQTLLKNVIEKHKGNLFLNMDIGYFVTEGFQPAIGFNYFTSFFSDSNNNIEALAINVGFTLERQENYLLVISVPFDVYGRNIEKSTGLTFALTITIN